MEWLVKVAGGRRGRPPCGVDRLKGLLEPLPVTVDQAVVGAVEVVDRIGILVVHHADGAGTRGVVPATVVVADFMAQRVGGGTDALIQAN